MEHNLSNQFTNNLKHIIEEKAILLKDISKAMSYGEKNVNSITRQLKGEVQPTWERTCDLIEYLNNNGVSIDMLFGNNKVVSQAEDGKQYKKLQAELNEVKKQYNELVNFIKQYEEILNICSELTDKQLDTFKTLISRPIFTDVLRRIRIYANRYHTENELLKDKYFFTPYHFYNQAALDALIQQTIYILRKKYIDDKQNETKEKWSKKRKDYLAERKVKNLKIDGRSSQKDKFMKEYSSQLGDETSLYSYDYITSHFGNIYSDLFRIDNGEVCDTKPYTRRSEDTYDEKLLTAEELDEEFKLVAIIEEDLDQLYIEALEEEEYKKHEVF